MSDILKPCPFCGSENVKSGGDDKIVGSWCLNCGAAGPNGYLTINGNYDWNTRATLKVKPLVWSGTDGRTAKTPWGDYDTQDRTAPYDKDAYGWSFTSRGDWDESEENFPSIESAKASAQADYYARILSALEGME